MPPLCATIRLAPTPARTELPVRLAANPAQSARQFDLHRATQPLAVAVTTPPATLIDAETVIYRLEEAGQTLLCLPNRGHSTALRQTRHQYLAEAVEAFAAGDDRPRLPTPPAGRISRMDHALAWIPLIPAEQLVMRRIVGCRSLVSPLTDRHLFTWRRLARLLGADHKAVQRWHASGIDTIVATLNRDVRLAAAWDTLG